MFLPFQLFAVPTTLVARGVSFSFSVYFCGLEIPRIQLKNWSSTSFQIKPNFCFVFINLRILYVKLNYFRFLVQTPVIERVLRNPIIESFIE